MEVLFWIPVYLIIFFVFYFGTSYFVRLGFKKEWVERGRDWRRKGYERIVLPHAWIQKFFDEGYYEVDRRV